MSTKKNFSEHPQSGLWHPTMNKGKNPCDIGLNSHIPIWFKCDICQYNFTAIPHNNKKQIKCKHCIGDELCGIINCDVCFHRTLASYEGMCCGANNKDECEEKCGCGLKKIDTMISKDDIYPINLSLYSNKSAYFKCNKCPHKFTKVISQLPKNSWCPYCSNQALCYNNDCNICYEKSFASHPKAKYWSDKNRDQPYGYCGLYLSPRMKLKGSSNKKYQFNCDKCLHEFDSVISDITTIKNPSWCPYCANQKLCNKDDCKECHEKSFASHPKAKYWNQDKNGEITPRMKHLGSDNEKYWFKCNTCPHEFDACIYHITYSNSWCPYCCFPPLKLCNKDDCKECHEKSFASHPKAKYWNQDKNGEIIPRMIFKNCNSYYHLICDKGHDIRMRISNINTGYWCSSCINKTEQKLYELLIQIYPMLKKQYKVDWCKNISYLPFDFVIENLKIIIELDGPQHFIQISNWKSLEETRKGDLYKMKCANENGFSVIRILQEDLYYDRYDWLSELDTTINKIIEERVVQNIYLCKNNEYEHFNPI